MKNKRSLIRATTALKEPILIMKLTIFLTIFSVFQSFAGIKGQTVSLEMKDVEIRKVLTKIERQGTFRFLFNSRLEQLKQKVDVSLNNVDIAVALNQLFSGTELSFKRLDNNLIAIRSGISDDQDITVSGRITGPNGDPLNGVSVTIKGTTRGTTTNANGEYALTVPDNAVLVFSSVGFATAEQAVNGKTTVNITLQASTRTIDEVVVIGYGTANKRDLTGSIVKVAGKEVADKPNTNPVNSLQGKVAGLQVTPTGRPGESPDVRILGTISKTQTSPLYVVDGIFNDNIDYVNPSDIESIEVLKDPSSLAIFGVRGANGVIVVTTKSGKQGQLTVNFNTSIGVKKMVDELKLVDAAGYKTLLTRQFVNDGQAPYAYWDKYTGNTDWQKEISQNGILNYNNLSITSGTEKNKFYMGLGYQTDEGIIKHEKLQRLTLTFKDELRVAKPLRIGFEVIGYQSKLPQLGDFTNAVSAAPVIVPYNTKFGVYNQMPFLLQDAQVDNPLRLVEEQQGQDISRAYRVVGNVFAEVNFLKKFTFKATYYGDITFNDNRHYNPLVNMYNASVDTVVAVNTKTSVSQKNNRYSKFQQDYLLTYTNKFGDHGLTLLGGFSTIYNSYSEVNGVVSQYTTGNAIPIPNNKRFWYLDNFFADPSSRTLISPAKDVFNNPLPLEWEQTTVSMLARALYNYKGKYMLNASFRRDGSSDISPSHRFQNFGAVGIAWDISKEGFMRDQNIFDLLKLKGSWGVLGNQYTAIHYPFNPLLTAASAAVFGPGSNQQLIAAYKPSFIADPNLRWETVTATEIGAEFAVLNSRLNIDASYYNKQTKDLLTNYAGANGQIGGITNAGAISNKGIELSAIWRDKVGKEFSYSIGGNITTLNNKVKALYQGTPIIDGPALTQVGHPIGAFYGYVVDGIFQNSSDSAKYPQFSAASRPGDLRFRDLTGNGTITDSDRVDIGNPTPKFIYGFSVGASFKGFDLAIDIQGVSGNQIFRTWGNGAGYARLNYRAARMNAWNGEGTSNTEPIISDVDANNRVNSTYMIESGSYMRIRNVQVGYNFNTHLLSRSRIKSLRLYVSGQNLKTFKKNSGYTPEIGGSATSFGVDGGTYPVPAIYTAGLNVSF
ncbi:MAG: TonB-dependent receptor [Bacteroidetes bacterium]|nr:TonB-dependent receptor [Bacteroidota bacterium]